MTTPNPRGFPRQSAIHQMQFIVRERLAHWALDESVHAQSRRHNIAANPLWYMPCAQRQAIDSKLDALGL